MSNLLTDEELDELDARFMAALDDRWEAYNNQINMLNAEVERLRAELEDK